jgi:hypothetical protein
MSPPAEQTGDAAQGAFGHVVGLVDALAWPLAIGILVVMLRKPLTRFLEQVGGRIKASSAFQVSIELVTVPTPPNPWSSQELYEGDALIGGAVSTTTVMELFKRIQHTESWKYLIADVKNGKFWLISRLYLFCVILQNLRALECVVFVKTSDAARQRFIGVALAQDVSRALAARYPWLDQELAKAWSQTAPPRITEPLTPKAAEDIVNAFIGSIQATEQPANLDEWECLREGELWEHTKWLTTTRLNTAFDSVITRRDEAAVVSTPDTPRSALAQAILRRQGAFVALTNEEGGFKDLVDRTAVLERLAATVRDAPAEPDT